MEGRIWPIVGTLLLALAGCIAPFTRNAGSKEGDKDLDVPLVADVTDSEREKVLNGGLLQINAVGLVYGLEGSGDCPQGPYREILETEMRKQKAEHIRDILDSPDNALVLVRAVLHGGMRRGEPIDVEVTLPPNSRATSLRGGILCECSLRNCAVVNAGPGDFSAAQHKLLFGDILAKAGGQLLVGLENSATPDLRRAQIWEGGTLLADRPFYFAMKRDDKSAHAAHAVAERLNGLFREDAHKIRLQNERLRRQDDVTQRLNLTFDTGRGEVAKPSNDLVALHVPFVYCLNPERYLRVSRLVPLRETPEQQPRYREKLARMLLDPKDTVRAALRLEALGAESVPALKNGLESAHSLVRFASAEALAYLGSTAGTEELGKLAEKHRQLRSWALLALANLNEASCRNRLGDLLEAADPELRYGAFFALRLLCRTEAREDYLGGQKLRTFWLHRVAAQSPALIHVNTTRREEVVLFGSGIELRTPSGISAGAEFTITPQPDSNQCIVSRVKLKEEMQQRQATLQIDNILLKMAQLGAQYADVVDFLRKADQRGGLTCPLAIDAMPTQMPMDDLLRAGSDANFLRD